MTKQQLLKYFSENTFYIIPKSNYIYKLASIISIDLNIITPTIIFQNILEDARYYNQINVVSINVNFKDDLYEIKKALYHEIRHVYQFEYVKNNDDELSFLFLREINDLNKEEFGILEIDAYAYMKKRLKELDNIDYIHPNPLIDEFINKYLNKFLK